MYVLEGFSRIDWFPSPKSQLNEMAFGFGFWKLTLNGIHPLVVSVKETGLFCDNENKGTRVENSKINIRFFIEL